MLENYAELEIPAIVAEDMCKGTSLDLKISSLWWCDVTHINGLISE